MIWSGVWIRLSVLGVDRVWLEVGSYNRGHGVGVREIKMAVRYPSSPSYPLPTPALLCKTKVSSYWASSTHPNGCSIPKISPFSVSLQRFPRTTKFVTSLDLIEIQDNRVFWELPILWNMFTRDRVDGGRGWTIRETRGGAGSASLQPLSPFANDPHTRKRSHP